MSIKWVAAEHSGCLVEALVSEFNLFDLHDCKRLIVVMSIVNMAAKDCFHYQLIQWLFSQLNNKLFGL